MENKIRCNNCGREFEEEEDLKQFVDMSGTSTEITYFRGCPDCGTDDYLMDIQPTGAKR